MTAIRQLETELAQEKEGMVASLEKLQDATEGALDWRAPVRQRPLQAVAIAAVVGVGLGVMSNLSGRSHTRRFGHFRGRSLNVAGIVPLLLPAIARPLAAFVERRLLGMFGGTRKRSRR